MNEIVKGKFVRISADGFSKTIYQSFPAHSFWHDVVQGVGLAFDPLPVGRRSFCKNDQAAFINDLAKLVIDKQVAMEASTVPQGADIVTAEHIFQAKDFRGKTPKSFCEAE